ncbi:MAG: 2-dehydropantoate 2-reductase, partial [Deltaproteobacteria bacterium]|nr:2-dehydropantoate 2-reductase [Deltaproteobacteria bacterium]
MKAHREPKKVAVLGAGAMGSLFGGLLAEGGLEVTLIDVWQEHIAEINNNGLKITGEGGDRYVKLKATTDPSEIGEVDVVLVQTKARYTEEAVQGALSLCGEDTVAISFQNGLGNEDVIGQIVGREKVLGGVTAQGSGIVGPGVIRNAGNLPSHIGELDGGISTRVERIADVFTKAGLETVASDDIMKDIWKKLLANIGINAMSALCNFRVGEIFDVPETQETILEALDEAARVAKAAGVNIDVNATKDVLYSITGKGGTGSNRSGMLVDVLNKKKTEIDFINGAVVRLGKEYGIPTPVNKTLT